MSRVVAELLAAALKLTPDERNELAEQLLDSLDPADTGIDAMTDEEFKAELDRRAAEAERDPSVMIPWEEVRKRALEN